MPRKVTSDDLGKVHEHVRACRRLILDVLTRVENGKEITSAQAAELQASVDAGHRALNPERIDTVTDVQRVFIEASERMGGKGRELCGCGGTMAHGAVFRLASKVVQTIARGHDVRAFVDRWEVENHNALIEPELKKAEEVLKATEQASTGKKRSTVKGEARAKIVAALTLHHKYQDGSCLNQEPIGVNELARIADVAPSSVSDFFDREYKKDEVSSGHEKYKVVCRDPGRLAESLKVLTLEFSPHELYGRNPPDEGGGDEDD